MADELYLINGKTLTDIGDAIRQVTGKNSTIKVENFSSEILNNIPIYHTVTFKGFNNETLAEYKVKHGDGVVYTGSTPINSAAGRLFTGWDRDTSNITTNITVSPNWEYESILEGNCTFDNENYTTGCAVTSYTGGGSMAVIPKTNPANRPVQGITGAIFDNTVTSIVMPDTCTDLKNSDFRQCSNLQDIYFSGSIYQWNCFVIYMNRKDGLSSNYAYISNLCEADRIHTIDGCIINQKD